MAFHKNYVRHSASKLTTLSVACGGETSTESLEERWRPRFDSSLPVSVEDPLNVKLYDLGDILGVDPEIDEEEGEKLENICFAQSSLSAERIAAEMDENAEDKI
jgi:hypothetical protein